MIKRNRAVLIITSILILIPIIAGLVLWNRLPDEIPTHFGADNKPDSWSPKVFAVFGIPMLMLVLHWLCVFAASADPKRQSISSKLFGLVLWIVPLVTLVCMTMVYTAALGMELNIGFVILLMMGVLFIIIGNYLPKCRQNYTVGIKIPWTLNDEGNWNATHRFGGWSMMIGGIAVLLTAPLANMWISFTVIFVMVLAPIVYSFVYYLRHK